VGQTGTQPRVLSVQYGEIAYAMPAFNMYAVAPLSGYYGAAGELVEVAATMLCGSSTGRSGIFHADVLVPGTRVLFATLETNKGNLTSVADEVRVILGAFPGAPLSAERYRTPLFASASQKINHFSNVLTRAPIDADAATPVAINRSYSVPMDALAGDRVSTSPLGPFSMLGAHYAGFGAGEMARLEFHSGRNLAVLSAENLTDISSTAEQGRYADRGASILFARRAINASESLGLYEPGDPFKKDYKGCWVPLEDDQQGIYRHTALEGVLVDGEWETMAIPEKETGVRTLRKSTKPHIGMLSVRKGYDGKMEMRSATELSLVRSLYVPVPRELLHDDADSKQDSEAEVKWWQDDVKATFSDMSDFPGLFPQQYDFDMLNARQRRMRARTDNWKLYTAQELQTELGIEIDNARNQLEPLGEEKFSYDEPPTVEVEDKTTGLKHEVAALESCIRQLADGTIIISDGHGSEIRMRRGNIEISCPGDLKLLPGRDLVEMTPRTRVMNAGGNVQIQSVTESVSIKAEKNLTALSGNGADGGVLLLENRSSKAPDGTSWREGLAQGDPLSHGILIKSRRGLAILGKDMYMGIADTDDKSDKGLARTASGSLLIDGCGGILSLLGSQVLLQASSQLALVASQASGGAAMALSPAGITAIGNVFSVGTTAFSVGSGTPFNVNTLDAAGIVPATVTVPSGPVAMTVGGSGKFTDDVSVTGTVRAGSVVGGTGRFTNASGDSNMSGGGKAPSVKAPIISASAINSVETAFSKAVNPASNTMFTGAALNGTRFSYLSSSALHVTASEFIMAARRWQHMLTQAGETSKWKETPVSDIDDNESYVYPGAEAWGSGRVVAGPNEDGQSLQEGYIINTQQFN